MEPSAQPPPAFSELYERAACGLACTDEDGSFLAVNETFCQWVGRGSRDLIGRVKLQDLLTMGGRIFHQTHWAPLLQIQGSISEVKLEVVHGDGARIPMVMNAIRRKVGENFVHEIAVIVARDRDAYERELVASRKMLQSLVEETTKLHSEAKDRALFAEQMVGIVSHDLRNPLSTIQMAAVLLSRSKTNQEAVLGRVTRAAERATRMIADLLDFTQARLGKGIAVTRSPMDLHGCVADAVDELSLAYPTGKVIHEYVGLARCQADADRLAQLVGNLVSNAMAYGREGAPVVVTSAIAGAVASISVHNAGEPIPLAIQESIFQPMVRGEVDAGSRSVGLGLYIVDAIAKAHGGTVSVASSHEAGTTFKAEFPVAVT